MKTLTKICAAALLTAAPAWAQDADGDGMVTMEELVAQYPDVTGEMFASMDTDGDGALNEDEIAAGMLPS